MRGSVVLSSLLLLGATAAVAQNNPAEVCGTWHMTASEETHGKPSGDVKSSRIATLRLDMVAGKLTGTWISGRGTYPVNDLTYANRQFSFSFEFDTGDGTKRHMTYQSILVGDRLLGKLTTPRSSKSVNGDRDVERSEDDAPAPAP